ncbi:MAG TPA: hypothetical protein VHG33_08300, partial [Woeseiaceae bacterium]|nr:hypothetical protein [Woeseiaceae bacterium]
MDTERCTKYSTFSLALFAGALLSLFTDAGAEPRNGSDVGRELIEKFVTEVRTMSGRFEQKLVDENDDITESSSGRFELMRP